MTRSRVDVEGELRIEERRAVGIGEIEPISKDVCPSSKEREWSSDQEDKDTPFKERESVTLWDPEISPESLENCPSKLKVLSPNVHVVNNHKKIKRRIILNNNL